MSEILSSLWNDNLNQEALAEMVGLDGQRLLRVGLFEGLIIIELEGHSLMRFYLLFHQFLAIMHRQYSRVISASFC